MLVYMGRKNTVTRLVSEVNDIQLVLKQYKKMKMKLTTHIFDGIGELWQGYTLGHLIK